MARRTMEEQLSYRVLKVGGARLRDTDFVERLAGHIARASSDVRTVVVHGGGPQIAELHEELGVAFEKVNGVRITSDESLPLVAMALARVNVELVSAFGAAGVRSLGLNGADARLMRSNLMDKSRWGQVGEPPSVHRPTLVRLLEEVPVIVMSPLCLGPEHRALNVNADDVAQSVARALRCEVFDMMTDVEGVRDNDGALVDLVDPSGAKELVDDGVARGGMVAKLLAAAEAVRGGVGCVRIGTLESIQRGECTRVKGPIRRAHLTLVS